MRNIVKRAVTGILAVSLVAAPMGKSYAEEETGEGTEELTLEEQLQASYDIVPDSNSIEGWPQGPQIYGHSGIVMDMDSGAVLYEKAADDQHYPASITKMLTALVALENSELDDEVYFSEDSTSFLEYGDASIGMTPGEILSMNDALYGMLLASANEVSYAIAESVGKLMGGDYNTFIQEMNDRSAELGCTGSHWVNVNGLHDEQHYTTARDMALITSALYQFDEFKTVSQTLNYTIGETNLMKETRTFQQNHKMLWPGNYYYYEYCTGGKTGYTDQSRTTLVTTAENAGLRLVAVILQDDGDVYVDTRSMFDYAYNNFSKVSLSDQTLPEEIESYTDQEAYVVLPKGTQFTDLEYEITQDDEQSSAGTITYTYNGQNVGSAAVTLSESYLAGLAAENGNADGTQADGADGRAQEEGLPLPVMMLAGAAVVIALLFIIGFVVTVKIRLDRLRRKRRRKQARARQRAEDASRRTDTGYRDREIRRDPAWVRGRGGRFKTGRRRGTMSRDGVTGLADTDKEWKTGKWKNSVGVRMERSVRPLCTGAVFIYTACGNLWAVFSWSP